MRFGLKLVTFLSKATYARIRWNSTVWSNYARHNVAVSITEQNGQSLVNTKLEEKKNRKIRNCGSRFVVESIKVQKMNYTLTKLAES